MRIALIPANLPAERAVSRLLVLLVAWCAFPLSSHASATSGPRTVLLWNDHACRDDSIDQHAFEATLESAGFHPMRILSDRLFDAGLDSNTLLVVPHASASLLDTAQTDSIIAYLQRGAKIVTDGPSSLSRALGLTLGRPVNVSRVRDLYRPGMHMLWSDNPEVPWVSGSPLAGSPRAVYTDRTTGHPLGLLLKVGSGRCLFLAPLFDPRSGRGYARFPTLADAIVKGLGQRPVLHRRAADAYFDAGYRPGQSPDSIASLWKDRGIRIIHAAGWYSYDDRPYDYGSLIDACHRYGILVYAWLEWPYIGKGFWDKHPEWRQKNALLQDAKLDFLYLMDLTNPACMTAALADLDSLLTLDWDGIDVAEFTITGAGKEALAGPSRPDYFTGFTDYCRTEFKRLHGFDPLEFFRPQSAHYWRIDSAGLSAFYRYRVQVNLTTQHSLFAELDRINRKQERSWELVLTIVDNSLHPEFDDLLGFEMKRTVRLLHEFDVTLQVEDPYMEWTEPPDRYIALERYYRGLLGDRPFLIDVNVVPLNRDRAQRFATWQPVGTEVLQLWKYASTQNDRACFYSEFSVDPVDWDLMPYAMGAAASATRDSTGWRIDAPSTVLLTGAGSDSGLMLDDQPWEAYEKSGIIIPIGEHLLRLTGVQGSPDAIRLVSISGELLAAHRNGTNLAIQYTSRPRCALSFNRRPAHIRIDEVEVRLKVLTDGESSTIVVPSGRHTVVVSSE